MIICDITFIEPPIEVKTFKTNIHEMEDIIDDSLSVLKEHGYDKVAESVKNKIIKELKKRKL